MGNSKENLHTDVSLQRVHPLILKSDQTGISSYNCSTRRISSSRYCLIQHHISQGLHYKKRMVEITKIINCQGRLKIKTLVT